MGSDAEKLANLKDKYGPSVTNWLSKHKPEESKEK